VIDEIPDATNRTDAHFSSLLEVHGGASLRHNVLLSERHAGTGRPIPLMISL
jgi:hypothetical protein